MKAAAKGNRASILQGCTWARPVDPLESGSSDVKPYGLQPMICATTATSLLRPSKPALLPENAPLN